jgi:hypothetical protein
VHATSGTIDGVPIPSPAATSTTECPGCGAVLVAVPDAHAHPGASPSCTRLFEVTLGGLREEAAADRSAAEAIRLSDAAYDAQHPAPGEPARLTQALTVLTTQLGGRAPDVTPACRPAAWQTTVADVAADLDVVDLPALIETWAGTVLSDWQSAMAGFDT